MLCNVEHLKKGEYVYCKKEFNTTIKYPVFYNNSKYKIREVRALNNTIVLSGGNGLYYTFIGEVFFEHFDALNIGDNLLCKREYIYDDGVPLVVRGKVYNITSISDDYVHIMGENNKVDGFCYQNGGIFHYVFLSLRESRFKKLEQIKSKEK